MKDSTYTKYILPVSYRCSAILVERQQSKDAYLVGLSPNLYGKKVVF